MSFVCPDGGGECSAECEYGDDCPGPVPVPPPPVIKRPARESEWHEWGTMPRPAPYAWLGCTACVDRMGNGVCAWDGGVADKACVNFRSIAERNGEAA